MCYFKDKRCVCLLISRIWIYFAAITNVIINVMAKFVQSQIQKKQLETVAASEF